MTPERAPCGCPIVETDAHYYVVMHLAECDALRALNSLQDCLIELPKEAK